MSILFKREPLYVAREKARIVRGWERARRSAIREGKSLEAALSDYLRGLGQKVGRATLFRWANLLRDGGLDQLAPRRAKQGRRRGR